MASAVETLNIDWKCRHTWQVASYNTMVLISRSIGDIGTIAFDFYNITWPVMAIMALAIFNGLLTSIILKHLFYANKWHLICSSDGARHVSYFHDRNGTRHEFD